MKTIEEFQGKKEVEEHRYKILQFENEESITFALERYYSRSVNQCLGISLFLIILLCLAFVV